MKKIDFLVRPGTRLAFAWLLPFIACLLQLLLWDHLDPAYWLLFAPVLFLAPLIGGTWGGIGSTLISTILILYFFIPERFTWQLEATTDRLSLLLIICMGTLSTLFARRLRRNEEKYHAFFREAGVGIAIVDNKDRCMEVNDRLCQLLNRSEDEIIGVPLHQFSISLPANDQMKLQRDLQDKMVVNFDWQMRRKDGTTFPIQVTAAMLSDERRQVILRDTTERKRMENELKSTKEHLEAMINALPDLMFRMDRTGRILDFFSASSEELLLPPEEFLGKTVSQVLPEEAATVYLTALDDAATSGRSSGHIYSLLKRVGLQWYELSIAAMSTPVQADTHFIVLARNITLRIQSEAALRLAKEEAESANRAKSAFLANTSHEIRTPLNAILGFAQLLEKESLPGGQNEMVQNIRQAGSTLLDILNDIIELSRIEAGQLHIETRPFELKTLITNVCRLHEESALSKGLEFAVEQPAPSGQLIGDPLRLGQILQKLIGNAIKFTERGRIHIKVTMQPLLATTASLQFRITDTGAGIAAETKDRLFKPFTQADGSITRRFGGAGLGLSICKRLVEMMGGNIDFESTPGTGSSFWFEVPVEIETTAAASTIAKDASVRPAGMRLAGRAFLVVDDSLLNRLLVAQLLTREGGNTVHAGDGQEALEILGANPDKFAAVLMDIQMPVMDGLTATQAIRSELGLVNLPVIAVTAGALPEDRQRAREAGLNAFVSKPVVLEELVTLLLQFMENAEVEAAV